MPEAHSAPLPAFKAVLQGDTRIGDRLTGLGIMGFTFIVTLASVIVLASTLTQTRITSLAIDGVHLTVWKLDSIRQSWASVNGQIAKKNDALAKAEIERTVIFPRLSIAGKKYEASLAQLNSLLAQFQSRIGGFDPGFAADISGKAPDYQVGRIQARRDNLKTEHPELETPMNSIEVAYQGYQSSYVENIAASTEGKALAAEIEELKKGIMGSKDSMNSIFSSIKPDVKPGEASRIEGALYELQPTESFVGKIINSLVTTQPEVLTLSLVILMGVLGSSLQITHSFFREMHQSQIGSYFLQVCVGAIAALVIFVVAKAGIPVITDASKIGGDAPINPYFVSFIAIVSGLLSDRAISSVRNQGERFFGSDVADQSGRWLRSDMTEVLTGDKLSTKILADYLGTSEAAATAIIKGEERASTEQQKLISIYLRRPQREIFTDFPPERAG